MTTTERPLHSVAADAAPDPPPPRRGLLSRLSAGHLVMLLAALVAALANYALLRASDDSVRVAVASRQLRAGEIVTARDLAFVELRAEPDLLATLIAPDDVAGVEGRVLRVTAEEGDLISRRHLQPPAAPSGQRAMSIPIEPEHAVAGALAIGDRVDVIQVDGLTATYLVTDAEVLDVPSSSAGGIAGGLRSFSVSIAVDAETALQIAVAIRNGQLELVRSTGANPVYAQGSEAPADAEPPNVPSLLSPIGEEDGVP